MKKKLSKGLMHPMLLDYLLRFGTGWVPFPATHEFRIEWFNKAPSEYIGWQARHFGFIETRKEKYQLFAELRLTPKGLRRIARG